jgi:outer membrane protein
VRRYRKGFWLVVGILLLIVADELLTGVSFSQNPSLKFGSVDIHKAVNECQAGKEAKKTLTKEVEKFHSLVSEKQRELQAMKESLEKQGSILNPETRAARERELQTRFRDFQRWGEGLQNEINQKRVEIEKNIVIGLRKVIQKLGADEGYTLILEKNENITLFASKSTDITDQVIKAYDAQKK